MNTELFDAPRFAGCPPICVWTNLPAFDTEQDIDVFHARFCPGVHIKETYQCIRCEKFHFIGTGPHPTQDSRR